MASNVTADAGTAPKDTISDNKASSASNSTEKPASSPAAKEEKTSNGHASQDGSEKVISVQPKLDPKQPSVLKGKEEDSGVTEDSEDEDEDSDDSDSDSDQGEYFDLAHPTRFWNRVEAGMRTQSDPRLHLDVAINALEQAMEGKLSEDHVSHIIRTGLHACVVTILTRSTLALEHRPRSNDFLLKAVEFSLRFLGHEASTYLCQILFRVFLHNFKYASFYEKPSREDIPEELKKKFLPGADEEKAKAWAKLPKGDKQTSPYFLININFFGLQKGFDVILANLKTSNSLFLTKLLLKVPYGMREFINTSFLRSYIPKLMGAIFENLLEYVGKPLRTEDKSHYEEIKDLYLTKLLEEIATEDEIGQYMATFSLEAAQKLMAADTLERRLKGVRELKRIIERTRKPEEKRFTAITNFIRGREEEKKDDKWIEPKFVLAWLVHNGLVDRFFQIIKSHVEILRQGVEMLVFLSQHKGMTSTYLDQLWDISVGMHEHDKRVLFSVLTTISSHLGSEQVDHLLERVHTLPLKEYDVQALELVMNLTNVAIKVNSPRKWAGLDLLWKLVQDDSSLVPAVQSKAFDGLVVLLGNKECESQRQTYIDACMDNISKNHSVLMSIGLLRKVLDTFEKKKRRKVIEQLDQKQKVIPALLQDVVDYKKRAAAALKKLQAAAAEKPKKRQKKGDQSASGDATPPTPRANIAADAANTTAASVAPADGTSGLANSMTIDYSKRPHLLQLRLRLDFLEYILLNSALSLNADGLDTLWDAVITQALSAEEREIGFRWLESQNSASADGAQAVSDSLAQHLFMDKMLKMDSAQLTVAGYRLFERYFMSVNEKAGKIKKFEDKLTPSSQAVTGGSSSPPGPPPAAIVVEYVVGVSPDMVGITNLWEAALSSEDPAVADAAIEFLNNLHQNLEVAVSKARALKAREDYVKTAMDYLAVAATASKDGGPDSARNKRRTERCLALLRSFVSEFDEKADAQRPSKQGKGARGGSSDAPKSLKLWLKCPPKPSQRLVLDSATSVRTVKEKALEVFCFDSIESIKLFVDDEKDKELKELDRTLGDYKLSDDTAIYVKRLEDITFEEKDSAAASLMLSSLRMGFGGLGLLGDALKGVLRKGPEDKKSGRPSFRTSAFFKYVHSPLKFDVRMSKRENHPGRILSTPAYFDKCYSLLEQDEGAARLVWELLQLLPRGDHVVRQFEELARFGKQADLDGYLNKTHIYKLLYNLQVLEYLLSRDVEDSPMAVDWVQKFTDVGTVLYLVKLLLSIESCDSKSAKRASSQIIRTINLLVLEKEAGKSQLKLKKNAIDEGISKKLMNKLMSLIGVIGDGGSPTEDDPYIVQESLYLLIPLLLSNADMIQAFYKFDKLKEWMTSLILKAPHHLTREHTSKGISGLVSSINQNPKLAEGLSAPPASFCFQLLLPALADVDKYSDTCDQYFITLENLLKEHPSEKDKSLLSLTKRFCRKIVKHPIVETHATAGVEDKVLIGLMRVMQALAQKHAAYKTEAGSSLLKEVFKNCLFAIPSAENRHLAQTPPKCKTKASRNAAFKLLLELAKDSPHNFKVLAELIVNQSDSVDMGTDFSFSPGSKEKSSTGFLGLENQGATCYMNSLLQQLYNIPEFRQGILLAEEDPDNAAQLAATIREKTLKLAKEKERPDKPGSIEEEKPKDDLADNVLYQMQRMFAFLQESRKRSFDTSDFCAAYRDPDGRPVNPSVQMDANEFYNQLFDTLEQRLKKSSQEQLLRNIFGGSLSTQIIPTECEHRRERDEPFMSISVEVKNKSHLKDALNLFVEGELLTADNKIKCDICAKPVESVKRYVVKDLPPVLALHLKRFEFDYEKMKNEKLNSTCAFDMTLNVEPFTREGIAKREFERGVSGAQFDPSMMRPPSYYEYELTGIVVHSGSADFGHYYSYIKERVPSNGKERRWFEFNDTLVTPFDPAKIPSETFGGEDEFAEWVDLAHTQKRTVKRQKTHNAYILIYERKSLANPSLMMAEADWRTVASQKNELRRSKQHRRTLSADESTAGQLARSSDMIATTPEESAHVTEIVQSIRRSGLRRVRSNSDPEKPDSPTSESVEPGNAELRKSARNLPDIAVDTAPAPEDIKDTKDSDPEDNSGGGELRLEKISDSDKRRSRDPFVTGAMAAMFIAKLSNARKNRPDSAETDDDEPGSSLLAPPQRDVDLDMDLLSPRLTGKPCVVPVPIASGIWEENSEFLIRKFLFDADYFNFVWSVANLVSSKRRDRSKNEVEYDKETQKLKERLDNAISMAPFQDIAGEVDKERSVQPVQSQGQGGNTQSSSGSGSFFGSNSKDKIKFDLKQPKDKDKEKEEEKKKKADEEKKKEDEKKRQEDKLFDQDGAEKPDTDKDKPKDKEKDKAATTTDKDKDKDTKKHKRKGSKTDAGSSDEDEVIRRNSTDKNDADNVATEKREKKSKSNNKGEPGSPATKHKRQTSSREESAENDKSSSSSSTKKKDKEYDIVLHNIQLAVKFFIQVFSHSLDRPMLPYWVSSLCRLLEGSPAASRWLLEMLVVDGDLLKTMLLVCPVPRVRQAYASIITAAIETLASEEHSHYAATAKLLEAGPATDPPQSYTIWFMEKLLSLLKPARRKNCDQLFFIFAQFARIGMDERRYLLRRGVLQLFAEFSKSVAERTALGTPRFNVQQVTHLVDCAATLVLSCKASPDTVKDKQPPSLIVDAPFYLPDPDYEAVFNKSLLYILMRENVNGEAMAKLTFHVCWENRAMTKFFLSIFLDGIAKCHMSAYNGFLNCFATLMRIDDSLTDERMDLGLKNYLRGVQNILRATKALEKCVAFLIKLSSKNETFRRRMLKQRADINEVLRAAGYRLVTG